MKLTVNGTPTDVADEATVAAIVTNLAGPERFTGPERSRGVAVAVNGDVVPRSAWAATVLADGDTVEVLTAVQGG